MSEEQNFSILVLSCDKYADLWPIFFDRWFSLETDLSNKYQVFLGANEKKYEGVHPVKTLLTGTDRDWSSSFLTILEQIKSKKILVLLEDLLLKESIDSTYFSHCVKFALEKDVHHIKLANYPISTAVEDDGFLPYENGRPYRITVAGIWDTNFLMKMLIEGEDPWRFEIMGSYRASYSDKVFAPSKPIVSTVNLVEKGCWIVPSLDWAASNGINVDQGARKAQVKLKGVKSALKIMFFGMVVAVPWRIRLSIMDRLRKLFVCY